MAARTSKQPPPADRAADFGSQQFAVATESGATLMRGLEAMRMIQEQAVRQVMRRHASAAGKLGASAAAADLMALHGELLQQDIADTLRCWQDLVGEALEIHSELLGCSARLVNTEDVFAAARASAFHFPFAAAFVAASRPAAPGLRTDCLTRMSTGVAACP